MRNRYLLTLIAILAVTIALCIMPPARAINIAFRGGAEDHYWNAVAAFCKDGVRLTANEVLHEDGITYGDNLRYSIVLSTTSSLTTQQLPIKLAGGSSLANAPASGLKVFPYAAPQPFGKAQSLVLERWEHGVDKVEIETDPIGDLSLDDDIETLTGTTGNCTVATPPTFDAPPSQASGSTLLVLPGTPINQPIQASDADALDTVSLTAGTLPTGAKLTIDPAANPVGASLTWTPGEGQLGSYMIALSATDSTGRKTSYTIIINVVRQFFVPLVTR